MKEWRERRQDRGSLWFDRAWHSPACGSTPVRRVEGLALRRPMAGYTLEGTREQGSRAVIMWMQHGSRGPASKNPLFPFLSVAVSPLKPPGSTVDFSSVPSSLLPPSPFYYIAWGSELSTSVKLPPRISQGVVMYMFDLEIREIL